MEKKKLILLCLSFFIFTSLLYSQVTITITNPTASSKWRGTQTIEWSVINKTGEFLGPPPGYYRVFYAPSGTSIPALGVEPGDPWIKINNDIQDDGEESSNYSIDWNTTTTGTGNYIILIRGYNPDGECVDDDSITFLVDNTEPSINISYTPFYGSRTAEGWYNSTNAPIQVTIGVNDADAGVKAIRYKADSGSWTTVSVDGAPLFKEITFTAIDGSTLYVEADDCAEDNGGENNTGSQTDTDYKVDTTDPSITINVDCGKKTFTADVTDATSGVNTVVYSFNGTDWNPYTGETDIPEGTTNLYVDATDIAGNIGEATKTFASNRIISGYVKDYKGTALKDITVLLGGTENKIATTNTSGYYEFAGLDPFGDYFVAPLLKNNLPAARIYDGLDTNKTNQNFVVDAGWLRAGYDRGNTRYYQFASTSTLDPLVISEKYSISNTGTSTLTGVLNTDNKMDIIFTDGSALRSYYFTGSAYVRRWSPRSTSFNLTLLDGIQTETALDSMVLCGIGQDIGEIYNENGTKVKEIIREGAPLNIQWSAIGIGGGNFIFTGFDDDTESDTILFYSTLNDGTLWETSLGQRIIPGTETICLREAGKVALLIGSTSDTEDLKLVAIDIETGNSLWTKTFTGIRGTITPLVAPTEEGGWDDVIAIRTSTNESQDSMRVYVLSGATGVQKTEWAAPDTPAANTTFSGAVADIDNNGNNELVISDGSGNIYVVNLTNGTLINSSLGAGKVWAVVDFDGKADGKKEIIISSGTTLKVLSSNLTVLASRDMEENINNVVLGQTVGDGRIDIIVSLPSKTSIVRAGATADLPAKPVIKDVYSSAGKVYLIWTYTANGSDLSGFRIYRSSDGTNYKLIKTVAADIKSYTDSPSAGVYTYKVAAYNDYGETLSDASDPPVEVSGVEESSSMASCFIATAAYGTPMAKEVVRLRNFRDEYLMKSKAGRAFVRWYYRHSPRVAEYIRHRRWARAFVRVSLRPLLWIVSLID